MKVNFIMPTQSLIIYIDDIDEENIESVTNIAKLLKGEVYSLSRSVNIVIKANYFAFIAREDYNNWKQAMINQFSELEDKITHAQNSLLEQLQQYPKIAPVKHPKLMQELFGETPTTVGSTSESLEDNFEMTLSIGQATQRFFGQLINFAKLNNDEQSVLTRRSLTKSKIE